MFAVLDALGTGNSWGSTTVHRPPRGVTGGNVVWAGSEVARVRSGHCVGCTRGEGAEFGRLFDSGRIRKRQEKKVAGDCAGVMRCLKERPWAKWLRNESDDTDEGDDDVDGGCGFCEGSGEDVGAGGGCSMSNSCRRSTSNKFGKGGFVYF